MTESITTEMIRRAQAGDRASWEHIVAAHQQAVFRFAYLKCGDAEEAQDIAQETFIQAWQHLRRYDPARELRTWLLGIAVNRARNRWRAAQRQLKYLQAVLAQRSVDATTSYPLDDDRQLLGEALRKLSNDHQEVIALRYFLELPVSNCAQALGIAEGTVKSRLSRALAALEATLREQHPGLADEWTHND